MNIIVLIIDTLRYDYVGANGNSWIRTPNMDALAAESWAFDRAFTNSYATIPHRTDVMLGTHGDPFHPWAPLRFDVPTLPRLLAEAGYATQLIHDTPHLVNGGHAFDWPFSAWTFVRGAEVDRPWTDDQALTGLDNWARDPLFDFVGDPDMHEVRDHTIVTYSRANRKRRRPEDWNAAKLFLTASEFLRDNARRDNFFLWLDCFDPHEPWDAPPELVRQYDQTPGYDGRIDPRAFLQQARVPKDGPLPEAVAARQKAFYAAKVSWVDRWLGVMLETLRETGLDKNTAFILTADHGTNVGERGRFGKSVPVNEQEAHVPLLLHAPGRGAGRNGAFVQPQDICATVLGLAGAPKPDDWPGCDLFDLAEGRTPCPRCAALSGQSAHQWPRDPSRLVLSVFDADWHLNLAPAAAACRLHRLGSTDDVAAANPEVVEELRRAGLAELRRRGTNQRWIEWLESEGRAEFPADLAARPGPANWSTYWNRIYNQW